MFATMGLNTLALSMVVQPWQYQIIKAMGKMPKLTVGWIGWVKQTLGQVEASLKDVWTREMSRIWPKKTAHRRSAIEQRMEDVVNSPEAVAESMDQRLQEEPVRGQESQDQEGSGGLGPANEKFDESALDVVAKMVQQDKKDIQVGKAKEEGLDVLREALCKERKMLAALEIEVEKERNAVAIATSKTMAMISRLQEEKSAMQLVVAQLQRMAEEKAKYDEHAMALLKEILFKREAGKHALEKNLIMDTLGTLVLAMKPPTDDILLRPLVGQKDPWSH
ncbi:hypothetical protein L7F22_026588 [Adiantum nelumboides]|nr:hypothetical protein [Adiantum nelumboides]